MRTLKNFFGGIVDSIPVLLGVVVYVLAGTALFLAYAFLTGLTREKYYGHDVIWALAALTAPIVVGLLHVSRWMWVAERILFGRAMYKLLLCAIGAPIVMTAVSYGVAAFGWKGIGYALFSIRYWTLPAFLVGVLAMQIVALHRRYGVRRASGSLGGPSSTPPSGSGLPSGRPVTAQRTEVSGSSSEPPSTRRVVACFSSRGTPFRWVRRPA